MKSNTKVEDDKLFIYKELDDVKQKNKMKYDLTGLYDRAYEELALQQSKRDQIITLYLAVFSFLIPFALSIDFLSWQVKGLIFLLVAIIGVLFSMIIIRYKIYKDVYWLCCQSLTVLMTFESEDLDKRTVQAVFYQSMKKKGKRYIKEFDDGRRKFKKFEFFKNNIFSAETIYFGIQDLLTSSTCGLSIGLMLNFDIFTNVILGIVSGFVIFALLFAMYFYECICVYKVLVDGKNSSFNKSFSKAWFLHFYV